MPQHADPPLWKRFHQIVARPDRHALERNAGNQTRTEQQLGIGSATLYRKLRGYRSTPRQSAARKRRR